MPESALCTGSYAVFCSVYQYTGETYPTGMVSVSIIYWSAPIHFRLLIYGLGQSSFLPYKLQNWVQVKLQKTSRISLPRVYKQPARYKKQHAGSEETLTEETQEKR